MVSGGVRWCQVVSGGVRWCHDLGGEGGLDWGGVTLLGGRGDLTARSGEQPSSVVAQREGVYSGATIRYFHH